MKGKFGGLGGLMKGLNGLMPQDDPHVRVFDTQTDLEELKKQEAELYALIGRQVVAKNGPDGFGDISERFRLLQDQIQRAEQKIKEEELAKAQQEQERKAASAPNICPQCGTQNAEGTKFCQQCGIKLGESFKFVCPQCGQENSPGTKFCGFCGTKLGG